MLTVITEKVLSLPVGTVVLICGHNENNKAEKGLLTCKKPLPSKEKSKPKLGSVQTGVLTLVSLPRQQPWRPLAVHAWTHPSPWISGSQTLACTGIIWKAYSNSSLSPPTTPPSLVGVGARELASLTSPQTIQLCWSGHSTSRTRAWPCDTVVSPSSAFMFCFKACGTPSSLLVAKCLQIGRLKEYSSSFP